MKFCNNMTRRHWAGTVTLGHTAVFTTTATLVPHRRTIFYFNVKHTPRILLYLQKMHFCVWACTGATVMRRNASGSLHYRLVCFTFSLCSTSIGTAGCNTWCLPNHNKIHVCNMHCQRIIRCMWAASIFAVRLSIDELWKALYESLRIARWLECHCLRYLSLLTNHWVLVSCFTCCGSNVHIESNDHVIFTSIFTMSYCWCFYRMARQLL